MRKIIGVDVGGTFTDVVEFADGAVTSRKVPTTPHQADGVVGAISGAAGDLFLHGTTAATNALLEEKGARLALVTDRGYEDLIEIGRQDRPSLYDSSVDRAQPLVDRELRIGFGGDVDEVIESLRSVAPEVVAIGLIESYLDSSGEEDLARLISGSLELSVLTSSQVSPEFREYERLATTALSAYLTPSVANYLRALDEGVPMASRLVMTSSGGLIPFSVAHGSAGRLVLSGPAAGAVAAAALGRHHGHDIILSFDMGGTSTDVCRITGGRLAVGSGHMVGGRVNRVPAVPIRTIGAGGGSVAWIDPGGSLRVGPRSAGSAPGPASYGRGGKEPTVTDANVIAGNIPDWLDLGGTVRLDRRLAEVAVGAVASELRLSLDEATRGILEIVDSHMEHALRSVSVEEGTDPRDAVLVAFGGAGGLHASGLARRLGIGKVLIPPFSGVFSALGLLLSGPRSDSARTVMMSVGDDRLGAAIAGVAGDAATSFRETFSEEPMSTGLTADVRYLGQSHELEIPASRSWDRMRSGFEEAHREKYGFMRPGEPFEVVNVRAAAEGPAPISWGDLPALRSGLEPRSRDHVLYRSSLPAGFKTTGPCVVVETNSAVLVGDGESLTVLDDGTIELSL